MMAENSQTCSSETEGLILSSFNVLQDKTTHQSDGRQQLKLNSPFLNESGAAGSEQDEDNDHANNDGLTIPACGNDAAEGDEMFDVTDNDHFRGDEAGDSLDNDTNNNSLDRDDEGDDEEEEEEDDEEEEEDGRELRRESMQAMPSSNAESSTDGNVGKRSCPQVMPDLRSHHRRQEGFVELTPGLGPHGFLDSSRAVWHSDSNTSNGGPRYPGQDWRMPLTPGGSGASRDIHGDAVLAGSSSPPDSRNGNPEDQHWKFMHRRVSPTGIQQHWASKHGPSKVVVGQANPGWVAPPKREVVEERPHDIHNLHHHGSMEASSHWAQHIRAGQSSVHPWHKESMGGVLAPDADMSSVRSLFNLSTAQGGISAPPVNSPYPDMACGTPGPWNLTAHLPPAPPLAPRPMMHHDLSCRRAGTPGFYHQPASQSYSGFQGQGREGWPQTTISPGPSGLPTDSASEHFKVTGVQPGLVCKSSILNKRGKGRSSKCNMAVSPTDTPSKARPNLDQIRQQAHPYQMKEHKKVVRDVYPATSANVHTLKASHIVSWYIDYLIHENEHLTQISRAFSLPVNLFHSDDFYFMESLKKKVHFPSLKFLSWMQQNLPSINVNAIDFHEGRPPVVSTWNQDWFWQNKSRRDIIHDVFFYFQHRRVTCEN